MRILQINAIYGCKSTGLIIKDIDCMLRERGYNSNVAFRACDEKVDNGYKIGSPLTWGLHALYTRITGKQGYASALSTFVFLKKIEKIKTDFIHLHNIHSNFVNLPLLFNYAKKNNIPVILTLHDSWFFTGKCYHFLDSDCEKWKNNCENCPKRFLDIPSVFGDNSTKVFESKKKMYKENDIYVVGCSKWIASCATKSPLFRDANILQIYNGIDTTIFSPDVISLKPELCLEDSFVIVTMANKWFQEKNANIRETVMNFLKPTDRIIIVGCNESQMSQESKDSRQIMLGYVKERSELAKIYATGDVFLNLTLVDTLPTVNMEAAACGTPVVTYDAGGSGELVFNDVTGYVVEPHNVSQLLYALNQVRNGKIKREECSSWAREHFDKRKNYMKYIQLYEQIYTDKIKSGGKT